MQNEETLRQLGFKKEGADWVYQGEHRIFRASVMEPGKQAYIWLHVNSGKIDLRPRSPNKGKPLWSDAGDCCSEGSLANRIKHFDKPL